MRKITAIIFLLALSEIVFAQKQTTSSLSNPLKININPSKKAYSALSNSFWVRIGNSDNQSVTDSIVLVNSNTTEKNQPRYFALIIGVNDYQFNETGIADLDRPVQDAQKLSEILQDYSFEPKNILLLSNPTRADVIDTFDELSKQLHEKDNLLVFYAGHGLWDAKLEVGYWLPADAKLDKKSSWISNSDVKDYIAGIGTKHTLLIADACFSGSIFKSRGTETITDMSFARLYKTTSRKVMTSGNLSTVPDNSKFFELLHKRLQENDHQYISSRQLFDSIYLGVINNTNSVPLYGAIQGAGDEGGEFMFIRSK